MPEVFQTKVAEVEQESAYFLLFGRQLSRGGNTSEVWVEVRLPEGGAYPCLRDAYQSGLIANHVESKVAEALGQGLQPSAHAIALAGLSSLTHLVDKSVNCCNSQQNAPAVTSCTDCWFEGSSAEAEYAGLLDGYGYLEYTGVSVTVDSLETPYTGALKSDYGITLSGPGIHLSLTEETNAFLGGLSNLGRVDVHYYDESNCVQLDQFLQSDLSRLDETSLAYEENIIIFAFGGEIRIFYKFAVGAAYGPGLETLKGGLPSSRQAVVIPAIAGWIMKKAVMAGTGVMMHVGITVAFEKWFGDYETWGEAWDNSSFTAWELFYAAVSGALAEHVVADFFGSIINGMVSYVQNTPSSSFSWEGFFAGGVVTGITDGVLGLLTGNLLGDLSDKGKAIFKKYAPNINLTPGGPGGGDPWFRVLKELMGLVPTFVAKPKTFGTWRVLYSKPSWRSNIAYLDRVTRYRSNGLIVVKEGNDLVIKQSNGVKVGRLDPNDPYYPGEMKVKGASSTRWFDPDDAGGLIVKKSWANPSFNQPGIDDVSTHLSRFDDGAEISANNAYMINRLNHIKNGQIQPTDFDKRFYTHELEEFNRFQNKGIPNGVNDENFYQNAHTASLESYSINEAVEKIYPPTVPHPEYAGY